MTLGPLGSFKLIGGLLFLAMEAKHIQNVMENRSVDETTLTDSVDVERFTENTEYEQPVTSDEGDGSDDDSPVVVKRKLENMQVKIAVTLFKRVSVYDLWYYTQTGSINRTTYA